MSLRRIPKVLASVRGRSPGSIRLMALAGSPLDSGEWVATMRSEMLSFFRALSPKDWPRVSRSTTLVIASGNDSPGGQGFSIMMLPPIGPGVMGLRPRRLGEWSP